jgi:hypothetical protein
LILLSLSSDVPDNSLGIYFAHVLQEQVLSAKSLDNYPFIVPTGPLLHYAGEL